MNLKSARERCFFENFHGHFLAFTGTFSGKFTRKCMPSRALFWPFSRALFMVHGHQLWRNFTCTFRGSRVLFPKKNQKCWILCVFAGISQVHGHISEVHGHFLLKMFTGTFRVHGRFFVFTGTFSCSRAKVSPKFHGHFFRFTGIFAKLFTGTFSRFTGKKKTLG